MLVGVADVGCGVMRGPECCVFFSADLRLIKKFAFLRKPLQTSDSVAGPHAMNACFAVIPNPSRESLEVPQRPDSKPS